MRNAPTGCACRPIAATRDRRRRPAFPIYVTAPLFAQYNGDSTHFASATKRITVHLRGGGAMPDLAGWRPALSIVRALEIARALS